MLSERKTSVIKKNMIINAQWFVYIIRQEKLIELLFIIILQNIIAAKGVLLQYINFVHIFSRVEIYCLFMWIYIEEREKERKGKREKENKREKERKRVH